MQADIIFNEAYVSFMTKFTPGKMQDIRLIVNQHCHVWVVFVVAPVLGKMFECKATDFCLFFS